MFYEMFQNRIEIIKGDITKLNVDAIVNAANSSLAGGGGVDGAIHLAAGSKLHRECMDIIKLQGRCPTGKAVITGAGNIPVKYIIHTVGPVWSGGSHNEKELLANAYKNCLQLVIMNDVKTLAFPNISTGIYGFPKELASRIALDVVREFLKNNTTLEKIIFVCYDDENFQIYQNLVNSY